MVDLVRLESMFRQAHAAGDKSGATRLAKAIRAHSDYGAEEESRPQIIAPDMQSETNWMETPENYSGDTIEPLGPSAEERAMATYEVGEALLSGAGRSITGGAREVYNSIRNIATGTDEELDAKVARLDDMMENAYYPESELGKQYFDAVTTEMQEQVVDPIKLGGRDILERTGSPAAAAAFETALSGMPLKAGSLKPTIHSAKRAAGMKPGPLEHSGLTTTSPTVMQRRGDIRGAKDEARSVGVDLHAPRDTQALQLKEYAETAQGGLTKGASLPGMVQTVKHAKDVGKRYVRKMYSRFRDEDAQVYVHDGGGVELRGMMDEAPEGYPVSDMPRVKTLLNDFNKLMDEHDAVLPLNQLENWRKKMVKPAPDAQGAALGVMKGLYDEWLEARFNMAFIDGSPDVMKKLKHARSSHARYRKMFRDDKVIRDMTDLEATPETLRKWVFGAGKAGFQTEAASVVQKLKKIRGVDSEAMRALQVDGLLHIFDPLFETKGPNVGAFLERYRNIKNNNPSIFKELFTAEQIKKMQHVAKSIHNVEEVLNPKDVGRVVGVFVAGHELAKRALYVGGVTKAWNAITQRAIYGAKSRNRKLMIEMLGYDPYKPIFAKTPTAAESIIQGSTDLQEQ